jgi:hypothetical protein
MDTTVKTKEENDMNKGFISNLIKSHDPEIHGMIENNKYTKPLLKQLDVVWKKIQGLLEKDLKQKLVIK